jgi:hypothetical protein
MCNRPAFDEMIGCDNAECSIEWFHVKCVGLDPKNKPKGKWYCPMCTQRGVGGPSGPVQQYYPQMAPMGAGEQRADIYGRPMAGGGMNPGMMPRGMPMGYPAYRPGPGPGMAQPQAYMQQQQQQQQQQQSMPGKRGGGAAGKKAMPAGGMRSSAVPPPPAPAAYQMMPRPGMPMPRAPYYTLAPPGAMGPPMQYGQAPRGQVMMPGPRGGPAGKPAGR